MLQNTKEQVLHPHNETTREIKLRINSMFFFLVKPSNQHTQQLSNLEIYNSN